METQSYTENVRAIAADAEWGAWEILCSGGNGCDACQKIPAEVMERARIDSDPREQIRFIDLLVAARALDVEDTDPREADPDKFLSLVPVMADTEDEEDLFGESPRFPFLLVPASGDAIRMYWRNRNHLEMARAAVEGGDFHPGDEFTVIDLSDQGNHPLSMRYRVRAFVELA